MFDWFRKPKPAVPAIVQAGAFTTDLLQTHPLGDFDRSNIMARSIQRTPEHFRPVTASGATVAMDAAQTVAMDDNIQYAKAVFAANGYGINEQQLAWFVNQGFIGYQVAALLAQNWLVDKACTMPARDAARNWYELSANDGQEVDPKIFDFIKRRDKHFRLKHNTVQAKRFSRIFGIRVCMFKIDTPNPTEFYGNPFNIDAVKPGSYKGISQIDPYWIYPELDLAASSDPSAINFYEPTWYRVNALRIHSSHLIILRNDEVADILKPTYYYGGVPTPQRIAERIYAAERTANEAPMLAMTKRVTALKLDLSQAMANEMSFNARLAAWIGYRDNYGVKVLGGEEELQQFDISLADLDSVIMTQYQLVAAIAEVPATKLLGTSPKGFNATGEFEESSYHEFLESIQEHDMTPLVERHYELLMKSEITPKFGINVEIVPQWNPVDSPTAAELADINLKKAQTATQLAQAGAIDGQDIRESLITDKKSGYNGLSDNAPDLEDDDEGELNSDAMDAEEHWITVNGAHVKIDGKGKVVEGASGHLSSPAQHAHSLKHYTGAGSKIINWHLRGVKSLNTEETKAHIGHLDDFMKSASLPEAKTLYRGIGGEYAKVLIAKGLKKGEIIHDEGFGSSSENLSTANAFKSQYKEGFVMHIHAPKGSKATDISKHSDAPSNEKETLIARNSKMKVVKWEAKNRTLHVELLHHEE